MPDAPHITRTPSQRSRRTWRQWFRLARVRIGFVVLLICLISASITVWPRRGIILMMLMGGRVTGFSMYESSIPGTKFVYVCLSRIPEYGHSFRMLVFGRDSRVMFVDLRGIEPRLFSPSVLERFHNMHGILLNGENLPLSIREATKNRFRKVSICIEGLKSSHDIGKLSGVGLLDEIVFVECPLIGGGFQNLKQLTSLNRVVFRTPPSRDAMAGVSESTSITQLWLQRGIHSASDLDVLTKNPHLLDLQVDLLGNEGATLRYISQITTLKKLDITLTSSTYDELLVLSKLTSLKTLYLRGPDLVASGIERLREQLPDCRIVDVDSKPFCFE